MLQLASLHPAAISCDRGAAQARPERSRRMIPKQPVARVAQMEDEQHRLLTSALVFHFGAICGWKLPLNFYSTLRGFTSSFSRHPPRLNQMH